jgi:transposase
MPRRKAGEGKEQRRQYTQEFKREAVRLVDEGNRSVAVVARELGLRADLLHAWKRQVAGLPGRTARAGRMTSQDEEVRQLRREVAQLREERDILGKAMAFFARTTR